MVMAKRKNREAKYREQIENTLERLDEAEETLRNDALPETERERIMRKNEHRREQIASLQDNLDEIDG
ncbi:MAG TPA: small acid-soluble spore protein Tlp [Firmicutes bacterium]|jgi:Fe2+ transport system protein B|nr:small acid-soluble spore protein Tlp [Bacillota bacterium]